MPLIPKAGDISELHGYLRSPTSPDRPSSRKSGRSRSRARGQGLEDRSRDGTATPRLPRTPRAGQFAHDETSPSGPSMHPGMLRAVSTPSIRSDATSPTSVHVGMAQSHVASPLRQASLPMAEETRPSPNVSASNTSSRTLPRTRSFSLLTFRKTPQKSKPQETTHTSSQMDDDEGDDSSSSIRVFRRRAKSVKGSAPPAVLPGTEAMHPLPSEPKDRSIADSPRTGTPDSTQVIPRRGGFGEEIESSVSSASPVMLSWRKNPPAALTVNTELNPAQGNFGTSPVMPRAPVPAPVETHEPVSATAGWLVGDVRPTSPPSLSPPPSQEKPSVAPAAAYESKPMPPLPVQETDAEPGVRPVPGDSIHVHTMHGSPNLLYRTPEDKYAATNESAPDKSYNDEVLTRSTHGAPPRQSSALGGEEKAILAPVDLHDVTPTSATVRAPDAEDTMPTATHAQISSAYPPSYFASRPVHSDALPPGSQASMDSHPASVSSPVTNPFLVSQDYSPVMLASTLQGDTSNGSGDVHATFEQAYGLGNNAATTPLQPQPLPSSSADAVPPSTLGMSSHRDSVASSDYGTDWTNDVPVHSSPKRSLPSPLPSAGLSWHRTQVAPDGPPRETVPDVLHDSHAGVSLDSVPEAKPESERTPAETGQRELSDSDLHGDTSPAEPSLVAMGSAHGLTADQSYASDLLPSPKEDATFMPVASPNTAEALSTDEAQVSSSSPTFAESWQGAPPLASSLASSAPRNDWRTPLSASTSSMAGASASGKVSLTEAFDAAIRSRAAGAASSASSMNSTGLTMPMYGAPSNPMPSTTSGSSDHANPNMASQDVGASSLRGAPPVEGARKMALASTSASSPPRIESLSAVSEIEDMLQFALNLASNLQSENESPTGLSSASLPTIQRQNKQDQLVVSPQQPKVQAASKAAAPGSGMATRMEQIHAQQATLRGTIEASRAEILSLRKKIHAFRSELNPDTDLACVPTAVTGLPGAAEADDTQQRLRNSIASMDDLDRRLAAMLDSRQAAD